MQIILKKYWVFPLVYFAFCFYGLLFHEIWLDEAHHFLLAKQSNSVTELISNGKYEGHPILWDLIMYFIFSIVQNHFYLQFIHILISTTCILLIYRYSPFSLLTKFAISFGCFMLYEYSVLTRNYAFCILILIILLIQLSKVKPNKLLICVCLIFIANTHLFGLILSIGLLPFIIPIWKESGSSSIYYFIILFLIGVGISIIQVIPPNDHFFHSYNTESFFSLKRFYKILWVPIKGLLPLPNYTIKHYWNSNFLINHCKVFAVFLSLLIAIIPLYLVRKNFKLLFFVSFCFFSILLIFFTTPLMLTTRNCGFYSITIFVMSWLSYTITKNENIKTKFYRYYFTLLLLTQFLSGIYLYVSDLKLIFSNGTLVSNYLNSINKDNPVDILLTHQSSGPSVALNSKNKIIYIENNQKNDFCKWNTNPFIQPDIVIYKKILEKTNGNSIPLLVTNDLKKVIIFDSIQFYIKEKKIKFQLLKEFTGAVVSSENYYIYKLTIQ